MCVCMYRVYLLYICTYPWCLTSRIYCTMYNVHCTCAFDCVVYCTFLLNLHGWSDTLNTQQYVYIHIHVCIHVCIIRRHIKAWVGRYTQYPIQPSGDARTWENTDITSPIALIHFAINVINKKPSWRKNKCNAFV